MARGRPPILFLLVFAVALVAVVGFVGTTVFQALTEEERHTPGTFVEQVQALPFVADVETESDRVAGGGSARSLESWITLSPEVTQDPAGAAEGLAGVTWGYTRSHWDVEGRSSTADVSYGGSVDVAPIRWWTEGVAALEDADPDAALHCRITRTALSCEVETDDPEGARQALAGLDGSAVQRWLETGSPEEGQESGFALQVGGETVTDPRSVG